MLHKFKVAIICAIALNATQSYGQGELSSADKLDANKGREGGIQNFNAIRREEFLKLSGVEKNFEGLALDYDKDIATLKYSYGKSISNKGTHALIAAGTLGTSTNLSNLFSQDVLPVFGVSLTYNGLLNKLSKWYYDGSFEGNLKRLKSGEPINNIEPEVHKYSYTNELREDLREGKYENHERVYTYRYIHWLSVTAKYNNDKYGFFDASRPFNMQQYDIAFRTPSLQFSANGYYGWNHKEFDWKYRPQYIYWTVYALYTRSNNISDLDKVGVQDVKGKIIDTASSTERQMISKNESYYEGQYVEFNKITTGGRLIISPMKYLALNLFADYNFVGKLSGQGYIMNNFGGIGAGFYIYTGSKSNSNKFNINLGVNYKYAQSVSSSMWNNRIELVTSIPLGLKN